ncbi:MAG: Uma2 family endonuclease [Pyrinomonadaceae bacterium]|nr:Uma2 family endonuclease [Pyrinomonadaceae bacterium]
MQWSEIISNPALQDLPFKIETNEYGQIIMSAATNKHGRLQSKINNWLETASEDGLAFIECSIETTRGVKVADVIWCSRRFLERNGFETPYQESPEICAEVVSPSDSRREMSEKRKLYFDKGAKEVWICHENGNVTFYNAKGQLEKSEMFPNFPLFVEIALR